MWEAAQAHHYGLNWTLAMDAVFSAPARTAGLDHRIGFAVEGHDADLVIWDSMPLSLGATPAQVFIDGVKQLKHPHVVAKPDRQDVPRSRPDSHQRAKETRETGGNLSYAPRKTLQDVVFINVRSAFGIAHDGEVEQTFGASYESADWANVAAPLGSVVVRGSEIVCSGACDSFAKGIADVVDLAGGSVLPGLVGYGPALGVSEIAPEKSTVDGNVFDLIAPAVGVPDILKGTIIKGSEALSLGGKELQCADRRVSSCTWPALNLLRSLQDHSSRRHSHCFRSPHRQRSRLRPLFGVPDGRRERPILRRHRR